jgi:hypothetical protein
VIGVALSTCPTTNAIANSLTDTTCSSRTEAIELVGRRGRCVVEHAGVAGSIVLPDNVITSGSAPTMVVSALTYIAAWLPVYAATITAIAVNANAIENGRVHVQSGQPTLGGTILDNAQVVLTAAVAGAHGAHFGAV